MKRILSLLFVLPLLLCLMAGCTPAEPEVTIDIEALATDLSKVPFVDEMVAISAESVAARYGFTSGATKVIVYGGSGATPEEIVVAEYASASDAKNGHEKFKDHLDAQKTTFDDYNADFRPLLDTPVLEQIGKYVVYCVCDEPSRAQAVVDSYK